MPADGAAAPDDVDGPPAVPPPVAEVEVLDALETDNQFLLQGDVFTEDLVYTWIAY